MFVYLKGLENFACINIFIQLDNCIFKELGAEFWIGFRNIVGHLFYIHSLS